MTQKQKEMLVCLIKLADEHWAEFNRLYRDTELKKLDEDEFAQLEQEVLKL